MIRQYWVACLASLLMLGFLVVFQGQGCREDASVAVEAPSTQSIRPDPQASEFQEVMPEFELSGIAHPGRTLAQRLGLEEELGAQPLVLVFHDEPEFEKLWHMLSLEQRTGIEKPVVDFDQNVVMLVLMQPASEESFPLPLMRKMYLNPSKDYLLILFDGMQPQEKVLLPPDAGSPWYMAVVPREYVDKPPALVFFEHEVATTEQNPVF